MADPFLILHKVRGFPAFDIAERNNDMGTPSDPGPWWIIPTSGHRAYPYLIWDMEDLYDGSDMGMHKPGYIYDGIDEATPTWLALPDHYHAEASRSSLAKAAGDLLSLIGLKPKATQPPIKRRSIP